jgi:ubiquinone/menaquinone biosynthesis C-methylase UbiE
MDSPQNLTRACCDTPDQRYTLVNGPPEAHRLREQAAHLKGLSAALLDRIPFRHGWSSIDIGCGPAGVLDLLAERVGPGGLVVGVELDAGQVESARALARQQGLARVAVINADARCSPLPSAAFDVTHTRLVLVNIPNPGELVAEMARLLKPGGWAAVLEADVIGLCHPPDPAWESLVELLAATYRADGADPHIGRRLPQLLRDAGLVEADVEAVTEQCPPGHPQRTVIVDLLHNMAAKMARRGLVSEHHLGQLISRVRCHLDNPQTLVVPVIYFLAWARKPPGQESAGPAISTSTGVDTGRGPSSLLRSPTPWR